ncbi:hypothetical protein V1264_015769 [Littorina saxatilis]|uniref:Uncharacterized protein n=2 Tax=Littorina saxatilis TaxID=31220 RepID=A0AAN9GFK2_9CAEN
MHFPHTQATVATKRTISEALDTDSGRSTVCAKIVKVSPVKHVRDGTLPVRSIGVADESGTTKIVLFKDLAEQAFREGDIITCTELYRKTFQQTQQLTAHASSQLQFVQDDDLLFLETSSTHFDDDPDFSRSNPPSHTVQEIIFVDVYTICTKPPCHKKKYQQGACPLCQSTESNKTSARAVLKLQDGTTVTAFQETLRHLADIKEITSTSNELLQLLIDNLPIQFSGQIVNNVVQNVHKLPQSSQV